MFGEEGEAFYPAQNRESRDCPGRAERPGWSQAELARGHARLDALADVQAVRGLLVGVEFDGSAADGP
jgi:hypothetical protein